MVTAVPYTETHRSGVLALLDDVPYKAMLWNWQFEDPAVSSGFDPVVVVDDGKVVGFNGVMPAPVQYGDRTLEALWSCDFYVDRNYRGRGVGRIVKETLHDKAPVIMTFGVSPKAVAVLTHLGWRQSPDAFTYKLNRRAGSVRNLALMALQGLNWLRGRGQAGFHGELVWSSGLPAAEEVDRLWSRVANGYGKIVRRDFAYLDWKYQRHPLATYRFLLAHDNEGELEAVLVVRCHNGVLRIVDWLGPAGALPLKRAMVRECRREYRRARQLTVTTTDYELGRALCDAGFLRARTRPSFFVYSTLPDDVNCERGWFLMTGDSDGELLMAARDNYAAEKANK